MSDESRAAADDPSAEAATPADTAAREHPEPADMESSSTAETSATPDVADEDDSVIRPEDLADASDMEEDEFEGHVEPIEEALASDEAEEPKRWFILKVQSNRERSICEALKRRVSVAGFRRFLRRHRSPYRRRRRI